MQSMTGSSLPAPVGAGVNFVADDIACWASGYLVKPADTSGYVYAGTIASNSDNTRGSNGTINATLIPPGEIGTRFKVMNFVTPLTANNGAKVFFVDEDTVALTGGVSNQVLAGRQVRVLTTGATGTILVDTCPPVIA